MISSHMVCVLIFIKCKMYASVKDKKKSITLTKVEIMCARGRAQPFLQSNEMILEITLSFFFLDGS